MSVLDKETVECLGRGPGSGKGGLWGSTERLPGRVLGIPFPGLYTTEYTISAFFLSECMHGNRTENCPPGADEEAATGGLSGATLYTLDVLRSSQVAMRNAGRTVAAKDGTACARNLSPTATRTDRRVRGVF